MGEEIEVTVWVSTLKPFPCHAKEFAVNLLCSVGSCTLLKERSVSRVIFQKGKYGCNKENTFWGSGWSKVTD